MNLGKLITIEGIEGAGKTTALNFIKSFLVNSKKEILVTREPGGTELAEEIRTILLHPTSQETMSWETELLLMFAARAQHINALIRPALSSGKWVISDRYVDASFAYQGGGRHIPLERIAMLEEWIVKDAKPDLTLLLDIDPAIGLMRADQRGQGRDRIEQEKIDFFIRVRDVYLARAKADSTRIKIIDASQSIEDVKKQIEIILMNFIKALA